MKEKKENTTSVSDGGDDLGSLQSPDELMVMALREFAKINSNYESQSKILLENIASVTNTAEAIEKTAREIKSCVKTGFEEADKKAENYRVLLMNDINEARGYLDESIKKDLGKKAERIRDVVCEGDDLTRQKLDESKSEIINDLRRKLDADVQHMRSEQKERLEGVIRILKKWIIITSSVTIIVLGYIIHLMLLRPHNVGEGIVEKNLEMSAKITTIPTITETSKFAKPTPAREENNTHSPRESAKPMLNDDPAPTLSPL